MQGILNLLKPPGMTSHDVVEFVRKQFRLRRVGHAGTLDPAAAGVLVLLVGKATRLNEYLTGMDKVYRGEITFGVRTDTQDATGKVLSSQKVDLTQSQVEQAFARFTGRMTQIPPMVSALKHRGKRLYQLAREGREVSRPPRPIEIKRLELLEFYRDKEEGHPRVLFECQCSKGTYMRTLAADIGEYLGCGAHLSYLLRIAVGPYEANDAWLLEEIAKCDDLSRLLLPLSSALGELPRVVVRPEMVSLIANGKRVYPGGVENMSAPPKPGQLVRLEQPENRLLALAIWREGGPSGYFHPCKVFLDHE
ncbi:MAG TPA: tRNA pseudouridine(55) synthase TruB [Firmicutes bacterium]|nr:tRNA pseudouridine(55) synthase TruB [Bacillota bacterium]